MNLFVFSALLYNVIIKNGFLQITCNCGWSR